MWGALFPGQGSQHIGMGKFLVENFRSARERFEEASDILNQDFKKLCFEGPDQELALTENTQPALLLVSTAAFEVVTEITGLTITAGAGHSVGEYGAMVNSGAMRFSDAIKAVRRRGEEMQRAVPVGQGGMCAVIGLTDPQVDMLCRWVEKKSGEGPLQPANYNAPGQVVVSGSKKALEWLRANFTLQIFEPETPKVRLIPLNVSAPFHSSMMKPAEVNMRAVLMDMPFKKAKWPVVQNFSASESTDPERLRTELISQISGSVKWVQCMQRMHALGIRHTVEFGAGKVLSGLAKKIDSGAVATLNISSLEDLQNFEKTMKENGFA
ncbi:MAG: ACP S-malonyltransferase [Bdellovibrionaceae bacterium]|nr:ACP S-malonyltransferase [Pseudobdellovibrionaceae bacterium]